MSKRRRPPRGKPPSERPRPKKPAPYDAEMIQDFLEQLLWELSIRHFENASAPGTINPELSENLERMMGKRSNSGLLFIRHAQSATPLTDEEKAEFRRLLAEQAQSQFDALELLIKGPMKEALTSAAQPGMILHEKIDVRAFLDEHREP